MWGGGCNVLESLPVVHMYASSHIMYICLALGCMICVGFIHAELVDNKNKYLYLFLFFVFQHLERLIIPNSKRIPNKTLCDVLRQNPDLLRLDISNKLNPKVNASIVETLAQSCRSLTVLKLSDYRVEDPRSLLVLCGRVASSCVERGEMYKTSVSMHPPEKEHSGIPAKKGVFNNSNGASLQLQLPDYPSQESNNVVSIDYDSELVSPFLPTHLPANVVVVNGESSDPLALDIQTLCENVERLSYDTTSENTVRWCALASERETNGLLVVQPEMEHRHAGGCSLNEYTAENLNQGASACGSDVARKKVELNTGNGATKEEKQNALSDQRGLGNGDRSLQDPVEGDLDSDGDEEDEDLYEKDVPISSLMVEDHSDQFGCMELETLWLDNVNLNDQVAAVLIQNLSSLRDLNVSDTDICNPWRLLDPLQATHLKYMRYLDVKSTALSQTALEMIPRFHPDLQKFSISSTMLPPRVYSNIGYLTGVADLELIGGQFYPSPPEEIFRIGIAPAICGIGKHLCSLNLTYFAHVEFEVIALNCPKLEYLDLSFTSIMLTYPCVSLGNCCPYLTSLNLAFCHIDAKEEKVEGGQEPAEIALDQALEVMIGHPPNLEEVHLSGLAVADNTVRTIFPAHSVHPLRTLNIARCQLITINGVQHVWNCCPFIQAIDMTHCKEISVTEYHTFEKKCFIDRPRFKVEGKIDWI